MFPVRIIWKESRDNLVLLQRLIISVAFYGEGDIKMGHSIFRTILKNKFLGSVSIFHIQYCKKRHFQVLPYHETDVETASFLCKRRLKFIAKFSNI